MRLLLLFLLSPLFLYSQTQIGNDINGELTLDHFGYSVSSSSDGSVVAIGSPSNDDLQFGQVRVFENNGNNWVQIGLAIKGEHPGDHFGRSVNLSSDGTILAIGAPDNADTPEIAGHVRVYENIGSSWVQIGDDIDGVAATGGEGFPAQVRFGAHVSISDDGNTLAIAMPTGSTWEGGYGHDGYMHIYENISGTWTQIGDAINTGISFLNDISLSGDGSVVAIFGDGDCGGGCWFGFQGFVKVYNNTSGVWTQIGETFSGTMNWDTFWMDSINSVSLNTHGSKLALGGRISRVFENINNVWVQEGQDIEGESYFNNYLISLSGDGTIFSLSNYLNSSNQYSTRIYKNNSGTWIQLGLDIAEGFGGIHGISTELSGDGTTLVIGYPYFDGNAIDAGLARVYDLTAVLSIEESTLLNVKIFPNPTTTQFTIRLPESQSLEKVNMYNSLGQFIETSDTQVIRTSHLTSGLYYVEVITSIGKAIKRIIIN